MTGGRTLTVLVADIVESTRLNATLGPESADALRQQVFARFDDSIAAHNGELIKTMGDGCLATFPSTSEGIAAGLDMIAACERFARQVTEIKLRVGIAVGDLTEDDGDVFGEAVVIASRLSAAAAPGQELVTDLARILAGDRGGFEWERVGDLFLKGIMEPVATSAAHPPPRAEGFQLPYALRSRPDELFVGRIEELEVLGQAWKDTVAGNRRTVLIGGEPGVGKTRLAARYARTVDDDGGLVLFARCPEDLAVPYQPLVDAFRASVDSAPRSLIAAHVAAHGGEIRRLFPSLAAPEPAEASPEAERLKMFEAFTDFVHRLAAEQPLMLVLDDAHWAAPATLRLVKYLIEADASAPLLVVITYRDSDIDRRHPLATMLGDVAGLGDVGRVGLTGLRDREMEWLVETASGDALDESGRALARALQERTAGNPFFASQLLRHMAETGALVHGVEGWERRTAHLDLPAAVVDVVGRRLTRLDDATNDALAVCAVAGMAFPRAVVARAAGVDNIDAALEAAVRARLLRETESGGYTFAHTMVRDALLDEQTSNARAHRHQSVGRALLEVYGDADPAYVHDLAFHFTEAAVVGEVKNAARFSLAAAKANIRRSDVPGAIEVLQRAWKAIEAAEPIDHEARFEICGELNHLHYSVLDGVTDALEAAGESARALHSPERLIRLSFSSFRWNSEVADPYALALIDDALLAWLDPEPSVLRASALASRAYLSNLQVHSDPRPWSEAALSMLEELGWPSSIDGRVAAQHAVLGMIAQPGAARALKVVRSFDDAIGVSSSNSNRALYLSGKAWLFASAGDRAACDAVVDQLAAEAEETGDPSLSAYALGWRVQRAFLNGEFAAVPDLVAASFANIGQHVANTVTLGSVWSMFLAYEEGRSSEIVDGLRAFSAAMPDNEAMTSALAVHLAESGLVEDAREPIERVVESLPSIGHMTTYGTTVAVTANAAAFLGDPDLAAPLLTELDAFAGEMIFLWAMVGMGAADRYRGGLLTVLGRHDEAIGALKTAIDLEQRLRAPSYVARSQYWLGRALVAAGRVDEGRDMLTTSRKAADQLGMTGVVRHADEQLAVLSS